MYSIITDKEPASGSAYTDLSFGDTGDWLDLPHTGLRNAQLCGLLFGDENAGPLVWLSEVPPLAEAMQLSPPHGHDSDNWRISILGTQRMGKRCYAEGEFRFQNGGVAYGPDDYSSGPEGGYGIIMMADRRGFPVRTVAPNPRVDAAMKEAAAMLGVSVLEPYPAGPPIRTNVGTAGKAMLEGAFSESSEWPQLTTGVKALVALLGDPVAGPVLLLLQVDPETAAMPSLLLETEVLTVVVAGSCRIGGKRFGRGDIRLQHSDHPSQEITAGSNGASLAMIIGDRRSLTTGMAAAEGVVTELRQTVRALQSRQTS